MSIGIICQAVTDSCRWAPHNQMGCQSLKAGHVVHIQVAACEAGQGFGASTALLTGQSLQSNGMHASASEPPRPMCQALPRPEKTLSMSAMCSINGCCLFKHLSCGPRALCTAVKSLMLRRFLAHVVAAVDTKQSMPALQ